MRMMRKGPPGKRRPLRPAIRTAIGLLGAGLLGCSINVEPVDNKDAGTGSSPGTGDSPGADASTAETSQTSGGSRSETTASSTSPGSSSNEPSTAPVETSQDSTSAESTAPTPTHTATTAAPQRDGGISPNCAFEPEDLGSLLAANAIGDPLDASVGESSDAGPLADAASEVQAPDADVPDADLLDAGASSTDDAIAPTELRGWASIAGYGQPTTTGGSTGALVIAKTAAELVEYAAAPEPLVIAVCGRIDVPAVSVTSNKTLVGIGGNARLEGGLHLEGSSDDYVRNVIISNLEIDAGSSNVYGFGVRLEYAHHVWLDHLEIFDSREGAIDVVNGSDLVTISWSRMFHSPSTANQEKRFGVRIGDVDDASVFERDGGRLRVTLHHNHWGERLRQRMPRVAYGQVHLANNYYAPTTEDYAIWGTWRDAKIRIEQNFFQATHNPHMLHNAGLNHFPDEDERADMLAVGNVYFDSSGVQESNNAAFIPPYEFDFDDPNELATLVTEGAGPRWPL